MDLISACAELAAKAGEAYHDALHTLPPIRERSEQQQMTLNALQDAQRRAAEAWRSAKLADPDWSPTKVYPTPMDYRSAA